MAVLILAGALIWFRPFLTQEEQRVAETPAPGAIFALTTFPLAPRGEACMSGVTITPQSQLAQFLVRPATPTPSGGPPLELRLEAPGYHSALPIGGGYPGGTATVPITPPHREEIGTVCFVNRGATVALLTGSAEARTISRSPLTIDGRRVTGDIGLAFRESTPQSLLGDLGEAFAHASSLTDHLLPAWLIWVIAIVVAFALPSAIVVAFLRALREDEAAAASADA
jgi:hypothetical protein